MPHILVLEPDKTVAHLVGHVLHGGEGRSVKLVESSQAAIDASDEQKPDLVVVELAIPDQNGLAFLHEFRSHSDWSQVPVIIHTKIPVDELGLGSKNLESLGVVAYLYKPTTSLARLVERTNMVFNQ